jgi:hypothetical protein
LRKLLILTGGWTLVIGGTLLSFTPIPIPLVGVIPALLGCAILTTHSRSFRRGFQKMRHRSAFFSRWLERFAHRAPESVKTMLRRTNPHAVTRFTRRRTREG